MKRPNLVNPHNWTPFQSVPNIQTMTIPSIPSIQIPPISIEPIMEIPRIITRKELIQKNSLFLNIMGILMILGVSYFLYSVYLERKIFSDYIDHIKTTQDQSNLPMFF
jgi:hypothetical protein